MRARSLLIAASAFLIWTAAGYGGFAQAQDPPGEIDLGQCAGQPTALCGSATDPGSGSEASSDPAGSTGQTGSGGETPDPGDAAVVCQSRKLDPQPPAGDPRWEGHDPSEGAVYVRVCMTPGAPTFNPNAAGALGGQTFWASDDPGDAIDPEVLARQAVDRMNLVGPRIESPRADGTYTVGVPMWMHVAASPTTWGPNTLSASAGGVSVTATATVSRVEWEMGDGSTVTCRSRGTEYTASYGMKESPDCGHVYRESSADREGETFTVTATSTWTVQWEGGGETGEFPEVRTSQVDVSVGQSKVLN